MQDEIIRSQMPRFEEERQTGMSSLKMYLGANLKEGSRGDKKQFIGYA